MHLLAAATRTRHCAPVPTAAAGVAPGAGTGASLALAASADNASCNAAGIVQARMQVAFGWSVCVHALVLDQSVCIKFSSEKITAAGERSCVRWSTCALDVTIAIALGD